MLPMKKINNPSNLRDSHLRFLVDTKGKSNEETYSYYKLVMRRVKYQYNTTETKNSFKESTHNRCVFCGQTIPDFNTSLTVEHKECKTHAPKKIFLWENLYCSCKACNTGRSIKKYDQSLYLDPRKIENFNYYFFYSSNGQIEPELTLDEDAKKKAEYMIKMYNLNRDDLVEERKFLYDKLIIKGLLKHYKDNIDVYYRDITVLSLYNFLINI